MTHKIKKTEGGYFVKIGKKYLQELHHEFHLVKAIEAATIFTRYESAAMSVERYFFFAAKRFKSELIAWAQVIVAVVVWLWILQKFWKYVN